MKKLGVILVPVGMIFFLLFIIIMAMSGSSTDANADSCSESTSITDKNFNEKVFKDVVKKRGNAFSSKADKIIQESKKAGVSPLLFASIMANESAWGTSVAIKQYNNPSGQMTSSGIIHYPSLDKGIEATGETLHNLVVERGLNTLEKLGSVYAPIGASNDPTGLNKNWVPNVKSMMAIFNGNKDVDGNISTGTDGCSLNDITVVGDKVSYFNKLEPILKKQIGKPYQLGASISGNNPSTFDCGGLTLWALQQVGVKPSFNRIAQNQFNNTKRVSEKDAKAGDLIFFEHTYDTGRGESITHVGFYLGGKKFLGANSNGVEVASFESGYWKQHLAGFGRVK